MKFFKKLKKAFLYYKSLDNIKPPKPQNINGLKIQPDYVAFLTCPYPVTESEIKANKGDVRQ